MTRRPRRASSVPQRVGSDEGLTSSRPRLAEPDEHAVPDRAAPDDSAEPDDGAKADGEKPDDGETRDDDNAGGRHTRPKVDQSKDDTDEGWGEHGDDDASARWLRENRPPHWD